MGSRAYVAVTPCEECAPWKTGCCDNCTPATRQQIDEYIEKKIAFHHNFNEDYGRKLAIAETWLEGDEE